MKIENMKEIMGIAHQSQNAVRMIGLHGIGKTQIVKQFAQEQGYHCEVLQLTVMDETDLIGMPVIEDTKNGKVTTWAKPIWLQRIDKANQDGKHCVVFLDELGRASESVRQSALQITLEGKIQEHSLGELDNLKSLIVVADNPSDSYDTAEFDSALEDRFITLEVETSIEGFLEYARTKGLEPVITDFLAEFPERLHYQPETDGEKGSTPRAWEALSRILKETPKDSPVLYNLIMGKVGKTVAQNFFQYMNNYINVLSVEDVVDYISKTKEKIKTKAGQIKASEKLRKITKKLEVISAVELGQKMKSAHQEGLIDIENVVIYVASLNLETGSGIAKTWKNSKDQETFDWFMDCFVTEGQKDRWYIIKLVSQSGQGVEA